MLGSGPIQKEVLWREGSGEFWVSGIGKSSVDVIGDSLVVVFWQFELTYLAVGAKFTLFFYLEAFGAELSIVSILFGDSLLLSIFQALHLLLSF